MVQSSPIAFLLSIPRTAGQNHPSPIPWTQSEAVSFQRHLSQAYQKAPYFHMVINASSVLSTERAIQVRKGVETYSTAHSPHQKTENRTSPMVSSFCQAFFLHSTGHQVPSPLHSRAQHGTTGSALLLYPHNSILQDSTSRWFPLMLCLTLKFHQNFSTCWYTQGQHFSLCQEPASKDPKICNVGRDLNFNQSLRQVS